MVFVFAPAHVYNFWRVIFTLKQKCMAKMSLEYTFATTNRYLYSIGNCLSEKNVDALWECRFYCNKIITDYRSVLIITYAMFIINCTLEV